MDTILPLEVQPFLLGGELLCVDLIASSPRGLRMYIRRAGE